MSGVPPHTSLSAPAGRRASILVPAPSSPGDDVAAIAVVNAPTTTAQKRRPSRAATAYPRKRATKACITCRFRRTKCDNARPSCAACLRLGATCTYQETDLSTFDPATLAILKRFDDLEELLAQSRPADRSPANLAPATPLPCDASPGSNPIDIWTRGTWPMVSIEAVLQWPPFGENAFPPRLYPTPRADNAKPTSDQATWRLSVDLDLPAAEAVIQSYFNNVHIYNPILEEEEVQNYIKMVRFEGIGWDAVSCLVLLIYAHGTIAINFTKSSGRDPELPADFRHSPAFLKAESYFLAAQKRMGMLLCRSGVIDAQCFFLAGVYLMTTLRPAEAWKMFVQALACCQEFAVNQQHIDNGYTEGGSNPKQRIYWTCFKSELELRLELNPSRKDVWDLTYPNFFPSPPEALKLKDEEAWYFYLAEIALMRMKSRILSYLCRSDSSTTSETGTETSMEYAVLDFEEQIDAWSRSLPKQLQLDVTESVEEQHVALRFILNGHLLDCQEAMYWQYVTDAVHGRPPHGSNADMFLRKGLKVCVDRIRQNRNGFYHRHHGTWLMLRSCSRSAFVLLAVVRCPNLAPFLPSGWQEAVADVVRLLRLWKDESTDVGEMLRTMETLFSP
ncbi:hypothetical protein BGZ63DRAFT_396019 [Mariannaea sp. PMI_226]|nr:hypothetical protein BGZ63DRAFT_396019 [Mariannaea sp. PMI_226]